MPRLEVKWSESKQKKPDLQRVLDDYFKLVRKNYKRKDANLHIQRNVNLIKDEEFFEDREVVFFSWKGDFRASGVIFHCQTCKRITIVQVMGHLKENIKETTSRILRSVQDHPVGQATLWSAYQLNAEVPDGIASTNTNCCPATCSSHSWTAAERSASNGTESQTLRSKNKILRSGFEADTPKLSVDTASQSNPATAMRRNGLRYSARKPAS